MSKMKLEKLNREQEYLAYDFDDEDFAYCDEQATMLVALDAKYENGNPILNDDGMPMTFSDWWTIVARERA